MSKNNQQQSNLSDMGRLLVRVGVWGGLFAVLYLLRSFFLLVFLTFVFSYVLTRGSEALANKVPPRRLRVTIVTVGFLLLLVGIGAFLIPNLRKQADTFTSQFSGYVQKLDHQVELLQKDYPELSNFLPHSQPGVAWSWGNSPSVKVFQSVVGDPDDHTEGGALREMVVGLSKLGASLFGIGSAFFLSLLFSFLIVLDLPRLSAGVIGLRNTSIRFIYDEVAPSIYHFSGVLGRALEAQLFIAMLNTVLTVIGLYAIGLGENVAFLAVIVFLCSFIPVAGVFISSAPICLMALEQSGPLMMVFAAVLIAVIHFVEAYILNPKIYGAHLRMNPVLVLMILTIGGKLFGVWGLVLGVPVCTYIFGHAIRGHRAVA